MRVNPHHQRLPAPPRLGESPRSPPPFLPVDEIVDPDIPQSSLPFIHVSLPAVDVRCG